MTTHHGRLDLRDKALPRSNAHARGRFGRLFSTLPPFAPDTPEVREALMEMGRAGGPMEASREDELDNPEIPAGYTFFGQFLDHDITFDPTSSLEQQLDPDSIENFRTPAFELDSLYGAGPAASPMLYDQRRPGKLLLDPGFERDLPRNSQGIALIGDPRNDENVIVSQLHLAFVKFHNAMVDHVQREGLASPDRAFAEARRLVRWHYQWVILHDFLPRTVGHDFVRQALRRRRYYLWRHEPFIPIEFAGAAYRFGHSQVRPGYTAHADFAAPIFDHELDPASPDPDDLRGGKRAPRRFVDWRFFFELESRPTPSKRIDTLLSRPLFALPFLPPNAPRSLAQRNLLRQLSFGLPSGQSIALRMRFDPLEPSELRDLPESLVRSTPLWLYVLREAETRCGGKHLGPVGARIVAEVFVGLLQGDPLSYLRQHPRWSPTLPPGRAFRLPDLLRFAGVV
jgi:hypothetical protein